MLEIKNIINHKSVAELMKTIQGRELPLISETASIEDIVDYMVRFERDRLLYVVDKENKLLGTISLGVLMRHVFCATHEPQVHSRFLISLITVQTAAEIMQKNPLTTNREEKLADLLQKMIKSNVKEIPVLDNQDRVIADLTIIDLLRFVSPSKNLQKKSPE